MGQARDAPFSGLYYSSYSSLRPHFLRMAQQQLDICKFADSLSSAAAAICAGNGPECCV